MSSKNLAFCYSFRIQKYNEHLVNSPINPKTRKNKRKLTFAERNSTIEYTNDFFWNVCFDKGRIKNYVSWFLLHNGEHKTVALLDRLKTIGFETATKAGISLGIDDLKIPPKKLSLLYEADVESQLANQKYKRGDLLEVERFQRLISSWHRVSEFLKTEVIRHFEETNTLNPVYMMAFSGARGNISQVRQLVGMRGLMADPQGRIIDFPILSNFREGLTLTEYLISCYGARKGIVDTALRTANAGYLTRRLVDVAHHVIISHYDCGTLEGVAITSMKEGNKLIYSLQNRLIGRVLAENIIKDGQKVGLRNQEISHDLASQIASFKTKVNIRSPLTCASKNLVCQLCYGWSLADGRLVSIGEAVGIIAAQSIGEPGTQLTMRTFHTGGVFSSDVSDQIKAPYDGIVLFPKPILGTLVRTPEGNIVFLTKSEGEFNIQNVNNENQITKYKIPAFTLLFIRHTQKVFAKDLVAQITGVAQQTAQRDDSEQILLSELEGQIFFASLRLRKYKTSSQFDSKQNKLEVWTNPLPNELLSQKGYEPSSSLLSMNLRVKQATSIGLIWLLAGKIYQYPIKTVSFVKVGDLITPQTIINELIWYNTGEPVSFTKLNESPTQNSLINNLKSCEYSAQNKTMNNLANSTFYIKQQSKLASITYKEFGYIFKLNFKSSPSTTQSGTNDFLIFSRPLAQQNLNQTRLKSPSNSIHPDFLFYSKKKQSRAGGLFMFEDDFPFIKNLQKAPLKNIISQIKQQIFISSRDWADQKKQMSPQIFNDHIFDLHIKTWLQKFYLLKWTSIISTKKLNADELALYYKNYSFSSVQVRQINNNMNFRNMRIVTSIPQREEGPPLHLSKRKTLLWTEQEFYILNGFYSNDYHTFFGLPKFEILSRPYLLQTPRLPRIRTSRLSTYTYKAGGKEKLFSLKRNLLPCSSASSVLNAKSPCVTDALLSSNNIISPGLKLNPKLTHTHRYFEHNKSWILLKKTFSTTGTKFWINTAQNSNLFALNRQGSVKVIANTPGLVAIQQKSPTKPSTFLCARKRYNTRSAKPISDKKKGIFGEKTKIVTFNKAFAHRTLSSSSQPTRQNEKSGFNLHQQIHNYQIQIKRGLVYIPFNVAHGFDLNKSYCNPGQQILDDLIFSQPYFIECFTLPNRPSEEKQVHDKQSMLSVSNGNPSLLDSITEFTIKFNITRKASRYRPISLPSLNQHVPLLVLIRPTQPILQVETNVERRSVKVTLQKTIPTLNMLLFSRIINYTHVGTKSTKRIINYRTGKRSTVPNKLYQKNQVRDHSLVKFTNCNRKTLGIAKDLQFMANSMKFGSYKQIILKTSETPIHYYISSSHSNSLEEKTKQVSFTRPYYLILNRNCVLTDLIFVKNNPFLQKVTKTAAGSFTGVTITNAFFKHLKLKLQQIFGFYRLDVFINTLTLYVLTEPTVRLRTIFKRLYHLKLSNNTSTIRQSLLLTHKNRLQPHFFVEYLKKQLRTKSIVLDIRPWYVRGFFQYRVGDLVSMQYVATSSLRDIKGSQDYWLPTKYAVNFTQLATLKQTMDISKNSIISKILNNTSLSFYQPTSFFNLLHTSLYFSTRQPLNFRPIKLLYTSPLYPSSGLCLNPVSSYILGNLNHSAILWKNYPSSTRSEYSNGVSISEKYLQQRLNVNYGLIKYTFPGTLSIGFNSTFDSKLFLQTVTPHVSSTKSLGQISKFGSSLHNIGIPMSTAKSYCFSPFSGEIINFKQSWTKSQLLVLTPKDQVSLVLSGTPRVNTSSSELVQRLKNESAGGTSLPKALTSECHERLRNIPKHIVGQFIKYGDLLNLETVSSETGLIIHISERKLTLRRSQYIAASNKALLHVKNNDWIEKNIPLATLPFQRLKAGDIVQGIPKIEQYFEARKSKAGRFYRDSIPNLMNAIFNHYLTRFRLTPYGTTTAAKKAILKVQQILLNGIQRVYRTQGVSIADKHIEIIVRQMTSKVRILNPGLAAFLPGELVDINTIVHLNSYLEQEIHFEPLVLGITQASLEVDSFISASSFQQTTRVLSEAALDKKRDYLRGLKENVILGNLIPAGTGHQIQQKTINLITKK